jgi:selenocysteine-specific elongation factor
LISIFYFSGAQIIDMMMLVVDLTKGIQTQTAECLVIGEIACNKLIVVLNKVDMVAEDKREAAIIKVS